MRLTQSFNVDIMYSHADDACLGALGESLFSRSKVILELWAERPRSIWGDGGRHVLRCCKIVRQVRWPGRISVMP
jgi:hypothetical protein